MAAAAFTSTQARSAPGSAQRSTFPAMLGRPLWPFGGGVRNIDTIGRPGSFIENQGEKPRDVGVK
jgi:hypothetical protein